MFGNGSEVPGVADDICSEVGLDLLKGLVADVMNYWDAVVR